MTSFADLTANTRTPDKFFNALLSPDVTCTGCEQPGGRPRRWNSPGGPKAAFYCDACETRVQLGLLRLRGGDFVGAVAAVEGWAAA